ncbi:MAG: hypothetical protein V7K57_19390 [Nostoc sp.]
MKSIIYTLVRSHSVPEAIVNYKGEQRDFVFCIQGRRQKLEGIQDLSF